MSDDATRIRQALNVVIQCWDDMLPDGPRAIRNGTIGRTSEVALPVPAHVLEVRRVALLRLSGWCQVVMDDQDLHPRLSGVDAVGMARFLDIHADYLATLGDEPADELDDSRGRILGIVEPPSPLEFVGRCDVCQGDLRARDGRAALCRDCGQMVDAEATREQLVKQAEDRLMTAAELVALSYRLWHVKVTHVQIHRWAKRGLIVTHGQITEGDKSRALYRVGEVGALVARMVA